MKRNIFLKTLMLLLFICAMFIGRTCYAQEDSEKETFQRHHKLSLVIGHSHVFEGIDAEGKRNVLFLPAWNLDYTYVLSRYWEIGLHTDITVEKFKVEKNLDNDEVIQRSNPLAPALMGIFKPTEHWNFLLGFGEEFDIEQNFFLMRAGVEYGTEFSKGWEVVGTLSYNFRFYGYDTWGLGLGIAKSFGK